MKKSVLSGLEGEVSSFIATEEDVRLIRGEELEKPSTNNEKDKSTTSYKDGRPTVPVVYEERLPVEVKKGGTSEETRENDFEYMRENLYGIIETSQNALVQLAAIAAQSQHPRAFEVLALLVKTISDANNDLMKIHKEKHVIDVDTGKAAPASVTHNNLFVGSTAELDEIIRKMTKKNDK